MERGGILHRDVSSGNILIVDKPRPDQLCAGILHDFDYSSITATVPSSPTAADDIANPPKLFRLRLEQDKTVDPSGHKERTVSANS